MVQLHTKGPIQGEGAMFQSMMREVGPVSFPAFASERHYMVPFMQSEGLPPQLSHWQKTVDQMLDGIETDQPIYFMADQAFIEAGRPHRRPGVHVDGYWCPSMGRHGHLGCHGGGHRGGHLPAPSRHRGYGGHILAHTPNGWEAVDFSFPEALLLASDVEASRAFVGEYKGYIGEGGDCSTINTEGLEAIPLKSNRAYCGTVATLHESLPVSVDTQRTLVRLNCPGVTLH